MINNIINQVFDGHYLERGFQGVTGIMVHRTGMDLLAVPPKIIGHDAMTICQAFQGKLPQWKDVAEATGGQNPYTVLIGGDNGPPELDGVIWQALPLDEVGWHARRFSRGYVGVALIGDGRAKPPSGPQRNALLYVLAVLCVGLGLDPYRAIKGHGEVDGSHDGTKAPGKPNACPGDLCPMNPIRDDVAQLVKSRSTLSLAEHGFTLFS